MHLIYVNQNCKQKVKKKRKTVSSGICWYVHSPLLVEMLTEACTTRLTVVTFKNGWDGKRRKEAAFQYVLEIYLTDSWKH